MTASLGLNAPLTIKYTQRRGSIAFKVFAEGVTVYAPKGTPQQAINTLIKERAQWINQAWESAQEKAQNSYRRLYQTGETFPFLGEDYPLSIIKTDRAHIELDTGELCIDLPISDSTDIQQQCEPLVAAWLQQQAEEYLPPRLSQWAEVTGWQPHSLKIRDYKSRWGSCDRFGRLTLNNRLMMAPEAVIDYVLIHELAHLKELNHSSRFWSLVATFCPDYKTHNQWLKKHSAKLQLSAEI